MNENSISEEELKSVQEDDEQLDKDDNNDTFDEWILLENTVELDFSGVVEEDIFDE